MLGPFYAALQALRVPYSNVKVLVERDPSRMVTKYSFKVVEPPILLPNKVTSDLHHVYVFELTIHISQVLDTLNFADE